MTRELLTEELLDRLISSPDIQSYLDQDSTSNQTLTVFLETLREANNMKRSVLARESGLNATVVYDIFAGKSIPGRDRAIMLAFGLKCDLRETQRLLRLAGASELWPKVRRDAIIIWCINQGDDLTACDEELWRLGEETLVDPES